MLEEVWDTTVKCLSAVTVLGIEKLDQAFVEWVLLEMEDSVSKAPKLVDVLLFVQQCSDALVL